MKDKIPVKEAPQTEKREMRKALDSLGIYTVAYDWANHKKQLGEYMANRRTHKAFLCILHLGKFAKCKYSSIKIVSE